MPGRFDQKRIPSGGLPERAPRKQPGSRMSFPEAISSSLTKYVGFSGRARRSEFWWFELFILVLALGVSAPIAMGPRPSTPELARNHPESGAVLST